MDLSPLVPIGYILGLVSGLIIGIQDARHREITLWPILGLWGSGFAIQYGKPWMVIVSDFSLNILFVALLMGILILYFRLRGKSSIMDSMIGWGDVLVLGAAGTWFNLPGYLLFYACSVVLALVISIGYLMVRKLDWRTYPIPLASYLVLGGIGVRIWLDV